MGSLGRVAARQREGCPEGTDEAEDPDGDRAGVQPGHEGVVQRPGAEVTCWASVHGFAVLHQRGPLKLSPSGDRDAALEGMLDLVERGLRP